MRHSTQKPGKPYPAFPLFPHATGRWAKKIRGKFHYFGAWDDPDSALAEYLRVKDYVHAGRRPPPKGDTRLTVEQLGFAFLAFKEGQADCGEIQRRTFEEWRATAKFVAEEFGRDLAVEDLGPQDFEKLNRTLGQRFGVLRRGNEITRIRSIFQYAVDNELISRRVNMGPKFKRPGRDVARRHRASQGDRSLSREEIHAILAVANDAMKAMILLGVNCGFGGSDCGLLEFRHLDLGNGWVSMPRHKTGIPRRAKLWSETVAAIQAVIGKRKEPDNAALRHRVFVTKRGKSFYKDTPDNPVAKETAKLFALAKIDRPGIKFYGLRRTMETVGGETGDQVAVNAIMGHQPPDDQMASIYRQSVSDARLEAVAEHVRTWLFEERGAS